MVSSEEITDTFEYKNGIIYWKCDRGTRIKAGSIAGSKKGNRGYVKINYKGKYYKAHRIAWCLCYGEWPPNNLQIDHINHIRDDNRIENLRIVTHKGNQENNIGKGYSKVGKKWLARIQVNGKIKYLGRFDTPEKANAIYLKTKKQYHPNANI